ncbi:MAG: NAD-dependent epimerase/dehydratase family protein [Kineosporiaceae bacterium]|nr:NAD-dependent epimerase/dehydratase family protein [Kineosporiaceae bacterium]MBK8074241.1 NAD-dependent epimerase/dehydratase family protein [Kineosporiaceae bacterium]
MRILVLGGTGWLGGEVARAAVAAGHEVSCLARGRSGTVPEGATFVTADRDAEDGLTAVMGTQWDLAVDVSRQPGQVRRAVRALVDRCRHYAFVSTGSVYADHSRPGADESARLLSPLADDVMGSMEQYGPAKVACERHVVQTFGEDRCLIARSGLIGGPGDTSGRSGYWPMRFAHPCGRDGLVLVPDTDGRTVQLIDVRDEAAWLIAAGLAGTAGAFDVVGETLSLAEFLGGARQVAGHVDPVVSATDEWLIAQGVQEWMGEQSLPLWLHDPDWTGFTSRAGSRARAEGLATRPLTETLADTLAWEITQGVDRARGAGLTCADERMFLAELTGLTPE